jgi:hypothetical protein
MNNKHSGAAATLIVAVVLGAEAYGQRVPPELKVSKATQAGSRLTQAWPTRLTAFPPSSYRTTTISRTT